jgi:hypothetical protein
MLLLAAASTHLPDRQAPFDAATCLLVLHFLQPPLMLQWLRLLQQCLRDILVPLFQQHLKLLLAPLLQHIPVELRQRAILLERGKQTLCTLSQGGLLQIVET